MARCTVESVDIEPGADPYAVRRDCCAAVVFVQDLRGHLCLFRDRATSAKSPAASAGLRHSSAGTGREDRGRWRMKGRTTAGSERHRGTARNSSRSAATGASDCGARSADGVIESSRCENCQSEPSGIFDPVPLLRRARSRAGQDSSESPSGRDSDIFPVRQVPPVRERNRRAR